MSNIYPKSRARATMRPTEKSEVAGPPRPTIKPLPPEIPLIKRRARRHRARAYFPEQRGAYGAHVRALHAVAPPYRGCQEDVALLVIQHYQGLDPRACSVLEITLGDLVKCSGN
jgi:hypothetical protein